MKKIILLLSASILILSLTGCDCVKIKRLRGKIYQDQFHNTHLSGGDKTIDMLPGEDNQTTVTNNATDNSGMAAMIDNTSETSLSALTDNVEPTTDSLDYADSDVGGSASGDPDNNPYGKKMQGNSFGDVDITSTDTFNAKNIQLTVNVTADYPRGPLTSNQIMLDGAQIYSPNMVNSGQKTIEVSANGYETASKVINIPSGSTEHVVNIELLALPRAVKFDFSDKKSGRKLTADQVIIGAGTVRDGGKVKPGKHTIEISKKGYATYIGSVVISPGTSAYVIRRKLSPENRTITRIKWIIYTEYPADEEIPVPESVLLDGVEIEQGNKISSGSHKIVIKHPGHEILRKTISVPAGLKVYTLKGIMETLPRKVDADIKYDVPAPQNLGGTSVTLESEKTGKVIKVNSSTSVKPGEYRLKIINRGYITIDRTVRIYPLISAYSIDETLEAKPVRIKTQINYDIDPPKNLGSSSVAFVGRNIRLNVFNGGSIKPGRYTYSVTLPGYIMDGNEKQINILPSEDVYVIRESLVVQPRKISFNMKKDGVIVDIQEIIIDGAKVNYNKTFVPGKQYGLVAKFRNYKTVEKTITIPPGPGPFVLDVPLSRK